MDKRQFHIVGMGPGDLDYAIPVARRVIDESTLLIASSRHLDTVRASLQHRSIGAPGKDEFCIDGRIADVPDYIKKHLQTERIAVLVSGDPTFYSLTNFLTQFFLPHEYIIVPGVGAIEVAFCRLGIPRNNAYSYSFHGKDDAGFFPEAAKASKGSVFACLTDQQHSPGWIAEELMKRELLPEQFYVAEDLCTKNERIGGYSLNEVVNRRFSSLNVVVCVW